MDCERRVTGKAKNVCLCDKEQFGISKTDRIHFWIQYIG